MTELDSIRELVDKYGDSHHTTLECVQNLLTELQLVEAQLVEAKRDFKLVRNEYHAFFRKINNIE